MIKVRDNETTEEFFGRIDDDDFIQWMTEMYLEPYYKDKFLGQISMSIVRQELTKRIKRKNI